MAEREFKNTRDEVIAAIEQCGLYLMNGFMPLPSYVSFCSPKSEGSVCLWGDISALNEIQSALNK